jgi:aminopeptidase
MDPRIREHAEIVVDHSLDVGAGDDVVVAAPAVAEDLVVAVYELLADLGAYPVAATSPLEGRTSPRTARAFLRNRDSFETPAHHKALFEAADAFLIVRAFENAAEVESVTPLVINIARYNDGMHDVGVTFD